MIDLHTHLLPGIDDGPGSQREAVELGRAASAAGTRTAAATPHIDYRYDVAPAQLGDRVRALRTALRDAGVPLEVVAGGELAPERLGELTGEELAAIGLGGGPWILLECPLAPGAGPLSPAVAHLQSLGFRVLLAHPERSPAVQRDRGELRRLVESGARCALTASAFEGRFGRAAHRLAERLLHAGLGHVLTSDAHDERGRPPDLRPGLSAAIRGVDRGDLLARWLTEESPAAILAGGAVPAPPTTGPARRRLRSG
ncbi:MAG TPA: CpsB/CapC family capsule biosynthesis tyrosine phosphatase [Solirubrobacteraceae bacterium]|nr:CpsB/CapC family capsule biosynthesis tyrosine phosphatase [Solirubrobacteraceae bacterium]